MQIKKDIKLIMDGVSKSGRPYVRGIDLESDTDVMFYAPNSKKGGDEEYDMGALQPLMDNMNNVVPMLFDIMGNRHGSMEYKIIKK